MMIDHTNKTIGTMMYDRIATWEDICKHKPKLTKIVKRASGGVIHVKRGGSTRHYWWGTCVACKNSTLVRSDRVDHYRCRCSRIEKPGIIVTTLRTCPKCHKTKPAIRAFWYITEAGKVDGYCKVCRKQYAAYRYSPKHEPGAIHYDREL